MRLNFYAMHHKQVVRKQRCLLLWLILILLFLLTFSLCAGEQWIPPSEWFTATNKLFVWQLRLPRALAVMLVGAALAVCGATMQALFTNPLAEPGLLGVSAGAGLGMASGLFFGVAAFWQFSLFAVTGALLVTMLLVQFSTLWHLTNSRLLLIGVAIGIVCSAVMTWIVYFSTSVDLRQLMYWMMGSFSGADWRNSALMFLLLPVLIALCCCGNGLNLLALGENSARQLGLSVVRWRHFLVIAVGWLTGGSVALAGAIGFVGLVVPHLLRLNGYHDHRVLLPASALTGAVILLLADIITRVVLVSAELPVGVVTSTFGAPFFIWLLLKKQR
ncbi:MAG: Vitamin B12 import system permease protein BtuC [Candidatus Erwinia impunctatus]|nr:Vitamin B12 import system permease protein BtuC [Culicoides impunctatus]